VAADLLGDRAHAATKFEHVRSTFSTALTHAEYDRKEWMKWS
jgi:hypothetical protein